MLAAPEGHLSASPSAADRGREQLMLPTTRQSVARLANAALQTATTVPFRPRCTRARYTPTVADKAPQKPWLSVRFISRALRSPALMLHVHPHASSSFTSPPAGLRGRGESDSATVEGAVRTTPDGVPRAGQRAALAKFSQNLRLSSERGRPNGDAPLFRHHASLSGAASAAPFVRKARDSRFSGTNLRRCGGREFPR